MSALVAPEIPSYYLQNFWEVALFFIFTGSTKIKGLQKAKSPQEGGRWIDNLLQETKIPREISDFVRICLSIQKEPRDAAWRGSL